MDCDAFISYSHAADVALAPALQRGLQRLARPWHHRRALEVFRDQTGLAVSPALWSSIRAALDQSEFFVLLACPQAAASRWVNQEIEHWLARHPVDRLLPVVTYGEWVWDSDRADFDWERSTAVPAALRGVFREEPRHLDLRWARGEAELDLRHGRFRDAVTGVWDGSVVLWDLSDRANPRRLAQLTGDFEKVNSVAFSADGRTLAVGGTGGAPLLLDLSDRANPRRLAQLNGYTADVRSVALSADSRTLATGSTDGTASLWDLSDRTHPRRLAQLSGHTGDVHSVAFAADGRTLASGSSDRTVQLWDLTDRTQPRPLAQLTGHANVVSAVALSADGRTVAAGSWDHTALLWDLTRLNDLRNHATERACAITGGLKPDDWARYVTDLPYEDPCR